MQDAFSFWRIIPLVAAVVVSCAALVLVTLAAKRFKRPQSNVIGATIATALVLVTGISVYVPAETHATRELNRANKDWWELLEEGDAEGAEKKLVRELKKLEISYGRVDPDHSPTMFNLAHVYAEQGRLQEAEQQYLDALELIRSDITDHEQWYCHGLRQTAEFYMEIGNYIAAEEHYFEGLEAFRAEYGDDHGVTIRMLRGLAGCNRVQKDYDSAEQQFKELIAILEPVHPNWLKDFGGEYADMLVELDRESEAEALRARWAVLEAEGK